jgi:hypothetical protein
MFPILIDQIIIYEYTSINDMFYVNFNVFWKWAIEYQCQVQNIFVINKPKVNVLDVPQQTCQ